MSRELGAWLRGRREDRGWTRSEMARQLIQAGHARGDKHVPGMDGMSHNIYRWERGGPLSERYKLHYCHALGISLSQFGHGQADGHPGATAAPPAVTAAFLPGFLAILPDAQLPAADTVAYRELGDPHMGDFAIRQEVMMAAHEGSDHAERAEQRGIGDTTLEQLRADLVRVSREYMTGDPLPMFLEMRRVRNRTHQALDRRLWPRDATELHLMAGCLNGLMAAAANNLGYPQAAEELARTGWAYATMIDHRPLMARLRISRAYVAYWSGYLRESADLARSGLDYLSDGENAAQLHLYHGLAEARLGNVDTGRRAIAAAHDARERDHHDELLEIGGEFGFSTAAQHYYAGFILCEIPGQTGDAITELERATELYEAGPEPGEHHSRKCQMLAHTDLAITRLRVGALDAAIAALDPVMTLRPGERTALQSQRLATVRTELAQRIYQHSARAREIGERIEDFMREARPPIA